MPVTLAGSANYTVVPMQQIIQDDNVRGSTAVHLESETDEGSGCCSRVRRVYHVNLEPISRLQQFTSGVREICCGVGSAACRAGNCFSLRQALFISAGILTVTSGVGLGIAALAGAFAAGRSRNGGNSTLASQRANLAKNTIGKGFGPQSPRDIDSRAGNNSLVFSVAPNSTEMNLCNIHFHKNAEHRGGEFTTYAGHGDGHGYQSGYKYSGNLTSSELESAGDDICPSKHGGLSAGDTIEVHYVHSTAQVKPGPKLSSCLSEAIKNPQLRVEAQVYVLVNDENALNFMNLTKHEENNGFHQAVNIRNSTDTPIQYAGSTTGPGYNEKGSPFQVTWSVRPKVEKVNIKSVGTWCQENIFQEDHAHGVRNLVENPDLLSEIT